MSKRAEQAERKYFGNLYKSQKRPERDAFIKGYEKAEKETIERAYEWMKLHTCTFNNIEEVDLYIDLFRKAMEEDI